MMLVRGIGIRDIAAIEKISIKKVLSVLVHSRHSIQPKEQYYDCLEVDELWTYVGKKSRKVWLIYAYHRATGEIVAFVWGKRDMKTAGKLKQKLSDSGVTCGSIATDDWDSFITVFKGENHLIGKKYTVGIEGNNCRLRHPFAGLSVKLAVFQRNCSTILKFLTSRFFTSISALYEVAYFLHHLQIFVCYRVANKKLVSRLLPRSKYEISFSFATA
jgi:IS1 family transposase